MRYRSGDEDSARWLDFDLRAGDIVISTRSKSGTTWMQMICALLVFRSSELPRPLPELSPWLDWLVLPEDELFASLEAQRHRRFIKTHTPLDGLPRDPHTSFIVVCRHPLDAAASIYHQSHNIDRQRIADLTGNPELAKPKDLPEIDSWLRSWVESDVEARDDLDSFNGVFHHLTDAWARRHEENVILVHYQDLLDDLGGEMQRIADRLGIDIDAEQVRQLAPAASFTSMRVRSAELAPDPAGVLKDKSVFFRNGHSGEGRSALSASDLDAYYSRSAESAPENLLGWLHRDGEATT